MSTQIGLCLFLVFNALSVRGAFKDFVISNEDDLKFGMEKSDTIDDQLENMEMEMYSSCGDDGIEEYLGSIGNGLELNADADNDLSFELQNIVAGQASNYDLKNFLMKLAKYPGLSSLFEEILGSGYLTSGSACQSRTLIDVMNDRDLC